MQDSAARRSSGSEDAAGRACAAALVHRPRPGDGKERVSDLSPDRHELTEGRFIGGNPVLADDVDVIDRDRYGAGWLYAVDGRVDPDARDAPGYAQWLDNVIDGMRGRTSKGSD